MSAFDDSRQATRAFEVAVDLAKQLRTELYLITVSEPLPSYTAFIDVEMPGGATNASKCWLQCYAATPATLCRRLAALALHNHPAPVSHESRHPVQSGPANRSRGL
jgi:nucleotide-binding universal stress UspA family protein